MKQQELIIRQAVKEDHEAIRNVLIKSYESAAADNRISRKQYPNLAGLQMALDLVAEDNPKAKTAKPEEFVDSRFIKELDDNGYIDNLYKNKGRP